ncbi:TIGR04222 domain-containing membrane protein [Luteolibacter sp. SL250]|uniref:TIGR04222 domain-containing membrane protein n=1 Tax=Luteolibacter sp. SL250 TaxID=2995170 RepID=UPI00226E1A1D|nr:TIGR04222 domain-containing membrane protein [Luteolibacter sp. SL250]WAC20019.1 TIGR04222 domain-containing membrane protein [Luteolibacter sp. SL250]
MNATKLFTVLGEVPVLDWQGPEFLGFYVSCYIAALVWALWNRRRKFSHFSAPETQAPVPLDLYETAFLAGGVPRCAQLAVVRLLERRDLTWRRPRWGRPTLVAGHGGHPDMTGPESLIHKAAAERGEKGMPASEVEPLVARAIAGIESRLAIMGLRPTANERAQVKVAGISPLVVLMMIGGMKLLIGLDREKPIILLVACMVVTLFTIIGLMSSRKFLTPAGERTLDGMRERHRDGVVKDSAGLSQTVALMGVAGAFGYDHLLAMDEVTRKELTTMSRSGAGSDGGGTSGCSSGCSSGGGDGGGGDGGGCGGCGGD